ncbi:MAG: DUF1501 domain-containing protein [Pirellulaceae bacterium]|nr:DUF1501 domain-containing protein [Planctomycetales bacterium]
MNQPRFANSAMHSSGRHQRRTFIRQMGSGFFGLALLHRREHLFAAEATGQAKRCLVLWMDGGPSQWETFDPKPGTERGGPTKVVQTRTPGIHFAEGLPRMALHSESLAVIRNVRSPEGDHQRGTYLLHTGYRQIPGFPRPSLGSIISHEQPTKQMPGHVALGNGATFGPAYLGLDHAPFSIRSASESLATFRRLQQRRGRIELVRSLSAEFDALHQDDALRRRNQLLQQLDQLPETPFIDALDIAKESARTRNLFGEGEFAESCLAGFRLLKAGLPFVEVQLSGWDTHTDNFRQTRDLCQQLDRPWSAIMETLAAEGMLQETLIVWMGEFGRTPRINAQNGRDHYPDVTPVVLAGGPIRGGRSIGATNETGAVDGESHAVADVFATIFWAMGIDPQRQFTTEFGAPTQITDGGNPIG